MRRVCLVRGSSHIAPPVLNFLPFTTHQTTLTARHVEGGLRHQCASESDQRARYKCIHAPWSLCYQANYITAKCLVNQRGGKWCPQLIRVPGFISLHISQYHITAEEQCNC